MGSAGVFLLSFVADFCTKKTATVASFLRAMPLNRLFPLV